MRFSEHWLRTFCDPDLDSDALGELMTMAGLEVEEQSPIAPPFSGVVVARILDARPHPDADKLQVCSVDVGDDAPLQIVCGAPNARAGIVVPCACVGAVLPGDFRIKRAKLRGVASFGMLCSGKELGLDDDHGGLIELPDTLVPGTDLRAALSLDDICYEIKLTPNRADCLSLLGVAREVSALTGTALTPPACRPVDASHDESRTIRLDATAACPRYCGRVITGVDARAQTPDWMRHRLKASGLRSISALVDITNYVMLELGQPLHAFDNHRLSGDVMVRMASDGETITLLDERQITLDAGHLLISDAAGAQALAGIMGGLTSAITLDTTEVFLESAFFAPEAVAGRARELGFASDASHRFERGVDFMLPPQAIERATALIIEICGGAAGPVVEAIEPAALPRREPLTVRPQRIRKLLGIAIDDDVIARMLQQLGLPARAEGDVLHVVPPSFRFDITIEEDLVEEIARLYGYDRIPVVPPVAPLNMRPASEAARSTWTLRQLLVERDFQEVINFSFVDASWETGLCGNANPIRLANPIASQLSVMRSSLIPSLIGNLVINRKRQTERVRIFELGRVFSHGDEGSGVHGIAQPRRIAALAAGSARAAQWGEARRAVDFYDLKGDLETLLAPAEPQFSPLEHPLLHPGRAARVTLAGIDIGLIGEIHPRWVQQYDLGRAPVVFEIDLDSALVSATPAYHAVSRQPAVMRDLALVVDQALAADRVLDALKARASAIVREITLFDVYTGKGMGENKKSLAFSVLMQDTERTLEDAEVDAAMQQIIDHARSQLGAELRS